MDSRPPPGAPPTYRFVTRHYSRSLRPIIITIAALSALWALFSGVGFFRNVSVYNSNGAGKLAIFAIVVGVLYMVGFAIECLGIFAAMTQKLPFVRLYAFGSGIAALLVAAVGLIQIVIHFVQKSEIINTCTNVNTGDLIVYAGLFGPTRTRPLSGQDAVDWCNRAYNRDSWTTILAFLITTALAVFFAILAFSFLHQVMDPSSPANVSREPSSSNRWRTEYPSHYNPPYAPGGQGGGYPAPAGPPPGQGFGFGQGQARGWQEDYVPPYPGKSAGYLQEEEEADRKRDPDDDTKGPAGGPEGGYGWGETAPRR